MFAWELAEMARRLLLVGVLVIVPFERGSMMQLVLATVICIIYLLFQTLVKPCVSAHRTVGWVRGDGLVLHCRPSACECPVLDPLRLQIPQ
jgi:hypothetical protein